MILTPASGCDRVQPAVHSCCLRWISDQSQWYNDLLSLFKPIFNKECIGNVIANSGFTRHFGFPNRDGKYVLHANYTALWGAMQSLGQLVGMILLNPVSDRIGRKMTMYLLWLLLASVSSIMIGCEQGICSRSGVYLLKTNKFLIC